MSNEVSRREFLKIGGGLAAGAGVAVAGIGTAEAAETGRVNLPYKPQAVAKAKGLKTNTPLAFTFPDKDSPCALIKTGQRVPGGVGPDADIVAYSTLCTHMGCPVTYDAQSRSFKCPCHYSVFDPEKGGQMVCGQATENLPQLVLEYDAKTDTVRAVAINGLVYGRQANVL